MTTQKQEHDKLRIPKTTEKYSYDLTRFETADAFKQLLERHGLTEHIKVEKDYNREETFHTFAWYNPETNLVIETTHNPITGEFDNEKRNQRYKEMGLEPEKGNCSHVAIEGCEKQVKELINDFRATAKTIKDGGKDAGFASVSKEVKENIPYFKGRKVKQFTAYEPETKVKA